MLGITVKAITAAMAIFLFFISLLNKCVWRGNFSTCDTSIAANAIKTELIKKRYIAPKKYAQFPIEIPYPAVHKGGINAVAIATPGNTFPLFLLVNAMIPAK